MTRWADLSTEALTGLLLSDAPRDTAVFLLIPTVSIGAITKLAAVHTKIDVLNAIESGKYILFVRKRNKNSRTPSCLIE